MEKEDWSVKRKKKSKSNKWEDVSLGAKGKPLSRGAQTYRHTNNIILNTALIFGDLPGLLLFKINA